VSGPPIFPEEDVEAARAWLRESGARDDDLEVEAWDLPGVALDVIVRRHAELSARQLAERTETSVDEMVDLYHELGIVVDDPDEVRFSEGEVDLANMLSWAVEDQFTPQEGHELVVVVARALRSIADASVSGFVQAIEARLLAEGGSLREWTETTAGAAEMGRVLGASLGPLFNHYLRQSVMHQREAQRDVSSRAVMRVAVGFIDLVGFTPLSSKLAPEDLSRLVGEFESRAFDLANEAGARIVKHIGDEIMFTAVDPAAACRVALALRDDVDPTMARPRGGLAYGEVITRHGDYYGPNVNLASRLTDEAVPGEILVPKTMEDEITGFTLEPAGRRLLKGFDEPVPVLSLLSVDGTAGSSP
jgi:adenylate cyclase